MANNINSLIFEAVNFLYEEEKFIFHEDITVKFNRGNLNVVTGENGSGKSTLLNLTIGIWDNYKGNIFIGKTNIKTIDKVLLRNMVAYGFQIPMIVTDSIIKNIVLGKETDRNRMEGLLEKMRLWEDILQMSDGIETVINKESLSQGQLQKIGIVRVLYSKSPVMIFDEPTSNLDMESVISYLDLMEQIKEKYLIIIISHDEKIIRKADFHYSL